ncbi:MAG: hypothetical protein V1492_05325 [Candidatus Micrarchaeota archaeon]
MRKRPQDTRENDMREVKVIGAEVMQYQNLKDSFFAGHPKGIILPPHFTGGLSLLGPSSVLPRVVTAHMPAGPDSQLRQIDAKLIQAYRNNDGNAVARMREEMDFAMKKNGSMYQIPMMPEDTNLQKQAEKKYRKLRE